jgi:diguanylate cyclase (GGDEF)-like protein
MRVAFMQDEKLDDELARLAALRRYEILDTPEEEPFQRIVELVRTVLGVPMAAVSLVDGQRQWLKAVVGPLPKQIARDASFCNETIKRHGPMAVEDMLRDGRFSANPLVTGEPMARSYLGVPLTTPDGYNIGALCAVDDEPRPFDAREAGILEKFAQIVLEQLELRQIAKQDTLTGALTRRGFVAEADKEFARAHRYERPSALVLLDVDRLRSVNERFGHPAGDAVLVAIANACMSTMRKSDVFGRIGGEEFALLLPETDAETARAVAERLRKMVEATIVETGKADVRTTVSCGVAPLPALAEGPAAWLSEADIALYEAKHGGRNRVVVAAPGNGLALALGAAAEARIAH